MAFDPEVQYANDHRHIGTASKAATITHSDAGGQPIVSLPIFICWADVTNPDYGQSGFSHSSHDSMLTLWKAEDTYWIGTQELAAPDPVSGDSIRDSLGQDWVILGVVSTRHGSWLCTVKRASVNV